MNLLHWHFRSILKCYNSQSVIQSTKLFAALDDLPVLLQLEGKTLQDGGHQRHIFRSLAQIKILLKRMK